MAICSSANQVHINLIRWEKNFHGTPSAPLSHSIKTLHFLSFLLFSSLFMNNAKKPNIPYKSNPSSACAFPFSFLLEVIDPGMRARDTMKQGIRKREWRMNSNTQKSVRKSQQSLGAVSFEKIPLLGFGCGRERNDW